MFRKLFVLCALGAIGSAFAFAQTPEPKPGEPFVRSFSWNANEGYLGVQTIEVTRENFSKFGLRDVRGVAVEKVIDGSPAAVAGIQNGDVIVSLNGEAITSSRKLTRLLSEISPDHTAKIVVVRGGSERELNVTVGKRPMPKFEQGNFEFNFPDNFPNVQVPNLPDMPQLKDLPRIQVMPQMPNFPNENFTWHFGPGRQIGIGVTPLSKQLAEHFGVDSGVMINDVRENSPAAKGGLKAGDIIVEIDGKAVRGDGDLVRTINEKKEGDVSLTVVRNGNRQTIKVTPEKMEGGFDFEGPKPPGKVNMVPGTPGAMPAPMPLNEFMFRGRII